LQTYHQTFIGHYPYELTVSFCGDKTYMKVKGKWHYSFFSFDAVKKVILSYHVSLTIEIHHLP